MKKKSYQIIVFAMVLASMTAFKASAQWSNNATSIWATDLTKNVGIGTNLPVAKLHLNGNQRIYNGILWMKSCSGTQIQMNACTPVVDNWITSYDENANRVWVINTLNRSDNNSFGIYSQAYGYALNISTSGNVGIKTKASPNYALSICGSIRAREVRVETGWCDYVFDENYKLPSLYEVEQFVKANKHLPDIPPATEVENDGIETGAMFSKQIKKIEELTLYSIQQQKLIDKLISKVNLLEQKISKNKKS